MHNERPAWAAHMDAGAWNDFAGEVQRYFSERGQEIQLRAGAVILETDRYRPRNLANIAAVCAREDRAAWADRIRNHFEGIDRAIREADDMDAGKATVESMVPRLRLRVYGEESAPLTDQLYARRDLAGTATFAVVELPSSVTHLTRAMTQRWNLSDEEVFRLAEQNVRSLSLPDPVVMRGSAGEPVRIYRGDHFVSSHALLHDQLDAMSGAHGAYVALPVRDMLAVMPIDRAEGETFVRMAMLAAETFMKGPGSITPFLYWYFQGKYERCGQGPNDIRALHPAVPERLKRLVREPRAHAAVA